MAVWTLKAHNFWASWPRKELYTSKKALLTIVRKQIWNWKNSCNGMLQINSSKSHAFSVKRAWLPLGWCHTQFFIWFQMLYSRASESYNICFRFFTEKSDKMTKCLTKNLGVWKLNFPSVYTYVGRYIFRCHTEVLPLVIKLIQWQKDIITLLSTVDPLGILIYGFLNSCYLNPDFGYSITMWISRDMHWIGGLKFAIFVLV